ncbi:MAG: hypothetical protein EZS28_015807 [Streblomastix strix]|uniref:Uncharacterized protein n=1 Tax=Streblomastix strix TaxID=222440 RepID=A0A5J4W1D7_9EUKA|nr:MAG: hypothetical protein EZS28_015807 [Streblomastix strix]
MGDVYCLASDWNKDFLGDVLDEKDLGYYSVLEQDQDVQPEEEEHLGDFIDKGDLIYTGDFELLGLDSQ